VTLAVSRGDIFKPPCISFEFFVTSAANFNLIMTKLERRPQKKN
jgi:hypothetical protein